MQQQFVDRKQFEHTQVGWTFWLWWVLVSTVGWAVIGALQWLVLRGKFSQAGWWVLASTVGWVVGPAVVFIVGDTGNDTSFYMDVGQILRGGCRFVAWGGVAGCITGGVLVWLLRHPIPDAAG